MKKRPIGLFLLVLSLAVSILAVSTLAVGSFQDVPDGAWYTDAVSFVYSKGVMVGVSSDSFAPAAPLSRAMMVQILYNLEGRPAAGGSPFPDVSGGAWYADAVSWAAGAGIVNGFEDGTFDPNRSITREQMTTILYRYAGGYKNRDVSRASDLARFADGDSVSAYALPSMQWAVAADIVHGTGSGRLSPRGTATRAEVAQLFMNYIGASATPSDLPAAAGSIQEALSNTAVAQTASQIVLVVDHSLTFWNKSPDGVWEKAMDVYCGYGRNGLAADRREGDGTTPIGAFPLPLAFGLGENPGTDMPYRRITDDSYWSAEDDNTYNTWVESPYPLYGEHLADYYQYKYAMAIGFNTDPVVYGRGSAIFLHCRSSDHWHTDGCVSLEEADMLALMRAMRAGAYIILVPDAASIANY